MTHPRRITYVGHATTLVELDGVRLLTDPVLRRRVAHLVRAAPVPQIEQPDAVLISHGHLDHLDRASLRRLSREARLIVPRGLARAVARLGFREVHELDVGEEVPVGAVIVRATQAEHGGRSTPGRPTGAIGFALLGSGRVFFAGDTDLFDGMAGLVPELDVALLPIWGWGPWIGPGHLDPERAAEAVARLLPRIAVPIHWGTLRPFYRGAAARFLREPADAFVAAAREGAPETEVRILAPGESLEF
jgi:L-ascorbate metabolism protein UlaG (beta-lactamase superfamily)